MKYDKSDIEQFYQAFKSLPLNVDINKVHHLINNPEAMAKLSGTNHFKPFKIIIMTSLTAIVISGLLLWQPFSQSFVQNANEIQTELGNKSLITDSESDLSNNQLLEPSDSVTNEAKTSKTDYSQMTEAKSALDESETENSELKTQFVSPTPDDYSEEILPAESCNWPLDTLIDGNELMLRLTKEELEKLGFLIKDHGIFYKNKFQGLVSAFHVRKKNGSGEVTRLIQTVNVHNEKIEFSTFDFYPIYQTNIISDYTWSLDGNANDFMEDRDALLAIRIEPSLLPSVFGDPFTFWFRPTENFYRALPERYNHLVDVMGCIKGLGDTSGRIDIVSYQREEIIKSANHLALEQIVLEDIGFEFTDSLITYSQYTKTCDVDLIFMKGGQGVRIDDGEHMESSTYNIIFVTNLEGRQTVKWRCEEGPEKFHYDYVKNNQDLLIPVVLEQTEYPHILHEDKILWFEPSETLFEVLPDPIATKIREEYNYLTSDSKEGLDTSCTFFEGCRSTLHIHDLNIYPNPASRTVDLVFSLSETHKGKISLTNISGMVVKNIAPLGFFNEGSNRYSIDISDVPAGIYLVHISTDKGFKTRRLLISK